MHTNIYDAIGKFSGFRFEDFFEIIWVEVIRVEIIWFGIIWVEYTVYQRHISDIKVSIVPF